MAKILTKREKLSLFITVGIIAAAIVFNFIIMPILDKFEALGKETMITRAKLIKYLRLLNQKDELEKNISNFLRLSACQGRNMIRLSRC